MHSLNTPLSHTQDRIGVYLYNLATQCRPDLIRSPESPTPVRVPMSSSNSSRRRRWGAGLATPILQVQMAPPRELSQRSREKEETTQRIEKPFPGVLHDQRFIRIQQCADDKRLDVRVILSTAISLPMHPSRIFRWSIIGKDSSSRGNPRTSGQHNERNPFICFLLRTRKRSWSDWENSY